LTDGAETSPSVGLSTMSRHRKSRLGQTLVEYSLITWIVTAALFASPFIAVPNPAGTGKKTMFALLMDAYQIYNNSYYFALCAPMP
jgi:hypothetical protein